MDIMKRREFGEPVPMYVIEADSLAHLLEIEHRYYYEHSEYTDEKEYFFHALVEGGDVETMSYRGVIDWVENMTFKDLAEQDLELFEEYEEDK
jgi:hypothetical protein